MKLHPLGNLVLLAPIARPTLTPGGIHLIPKDHRPWVKTDDEQQYVVCAVGAGRWHKGARVKPDLNPGDVVLCNFPLDIKDALDDGSKRILVDAKDCLAVTNAP